MPLARKKTPSTSKITPPSPSVFTLVYGKLLLFHRIIKQ